MTKKQTFSQLKLAKNSPILIACDHAGFHLKKFLIENLSKAGFALEDLGCNSAEQSVDYPDYAQKLAKKITAKEAQFGILICGSGVGISIAANRFNAVRAALCTNAKTAKLSRQHNNANVLCLGARLISEASSLGAAKAFLATEFEGERHERRVAKLSK